MRLLIDRWALRHVRTSQSDGIRNEVFKRVEYFKIILAKGKAIDSIRTHEMLNVHLLGLNYLPCLVWIVLPVRHSSPSQPIQIGV